MVGFVLLPKKMKTYDNSLKSETLLTPCAKGRQYSEIDLVGPRLFDATCQSLLKIKTMKLTVA